MIRVHDLWKSYGNLEVLKGLSLDIFTGETLVILGRSGVGKSVLLKQIIALETPDKGYVEVDGQRITNVNRYGSNSEILKQMGMLFQGSALFDSMNIGENTAFYLRQHNHTLTAKEVEELVDNALKMVGLEGTQQKLPSELSGGMRKRAALARLIVYRPKIILYDEPTTGLDPLTSTQINELMNNIKVQLGATSIVVTHDIRSALEIGDRLAFHKDGKIAYVGEKKAFFESKETMIRDFIDHAIIDKSSIEYYTSKTNI